MIDGRRTGVRIWGLLAFLAIATSIWSFRAQAALNGGCQTDADCNCNAEQQIENCDVSSGAGGVCDYGVCVCNKGFGGANCEPLGACCNPIDDARGDGGGAGESQVSCFTLTEAQCILAEGMYQGDFSQCPAACIPTETPTQTPTGTPTLTPTETPTNTPVAPGGSCEVTADCEGNLVCDPEELICCDRVCNEPQERCDLPGLEGTCSPITAPAPAVSSAMLPVVVVLLLALGGGAIVRRRLTR